MHAICFKRNTKAYKIINMRTFWHTQCHVHVDIIRGTCQLNGGIYITRVFFSSNRCEGAHKYKLLYGKNCIL